MKIFVPNESGSGESRVALVPQAIKRLGISGVEIIVESNAGMAASHSDDAYRSAGATIAAAAWAEADIVLVVGLPGETEIRQIRSGSVLAGMLSPYRNANL